MKSLNLTFICNSSDLIDRLSIIRGLRSTLGFRAIGRQIRRNGIFSFATLGAATILVFGVFARGIIRTGLFAQSVLVCTGVLAQSAFARNGRLGRNRLGIVGNGLRDRRHDERQHQAQNGGTAQNAC